VIVGVRCQKVELRGANEVRVRDGFVYRDGLDVRPHDGPHHRKYCDAD
jgi:hypothetical protein